MKTNKAKKRKNRRATTFSHICKTHSHVPYNDLSQIHKNVLDICLLVRALPHFVTSPAPSYAPPRPPAPRIAAPQPQWNLLPSSSLALHPGPLHSLHLHAEQCPCTSPRGAPSPRSSLRANVYFSENRSLTPSHPLPLPTHLPVFIPLSCFVSLVTLIVI